MEDMSDLLDKFTETTDDAVIGPQEIDFICFAEPQWSVRIQNARQWLVGRDPTEWQFLEVYIIKTETVLEQVRQTCVELAT